jgi:two-component system sensor histidine kinase CiaH
MTNPTSRLLTRTRRRLFVVTLGLVALLVLGIGAATAFVTLRALDIEVDRALEASVKSAADALHDGLPSVSEPTDNEDAILASSDTFLLVLDAKGALVANPSRAPLSGLPDEAAVRAARVDGRDIRTVDAGGVEVRLLTVAIVPEDHATPIGFVQGGFVLTLHDGQSASIIAAIALVAAVGLVGAAMVTLIVTGRALVPIRRSFEAQRRFVADASHELRTPTALIRANADVMEREGLVSDGGRPLVSDIITEADRLGRLVGDLLQLAASDTTGIVIEPRPVDLGAIATDTVRQADALATERGVTLVAEDAGGGPALVSGDRDRLVQLVLILFDNAFDHSPPGGIVTVGVRRADRTVELAVADQGPGIPLAERERVFEPFERLPGVRRDSSSGTGLGLAIARRIAAAHGGTIRIDDGPGGGAKFIVTFPADGGTRDG